MKASWNAPTEYVDGTPLDPLQDIGGFELQVDDRPAVSIPFAWEEDGRYEFELGTLELEPGRTYRAHVLCVAANGRKSDWSNSVEFTFARTPRAPFGLSVG